MMHSAAANRRLLRPTVPASGGGGALSALGAFAAAMSPGTWAQFTTATGQQSTLGVGNTQGTMTIFCNAMPWNAVDKCIEIIGCDHNYPGGLRHVRYQDSNNTFVLDSEGVINGTNIAHGYDHSTVNQNTGDVYHRPYNTAYVRKRAQGSGSWTTSSSSPATMQVAQGCCWWSGALSGGGAQGQMVMFCTGAASGAASDGEMTAYNPLTNTWFLNGNSYAPLYGTGGSAYDNVMEYSTIRNLAVYGGGNSAPNKVWRLNSDGTHGALTDAPGSGIGVGQGNLVEEPVTGNFLRLGDSQLWELNPTGSGTWTQQTGSRVPPVTLGDPSNSSNLGVFSCAIPDYGVVAYIQQLNSSSGSFWLYKHA